MDKKTIVKALCDSYKAKDLKDLENKIGYVININNTRGWSQARNGTLFTHIDFQDPFFVSMTNTSSAPILSSYSDTEIIKAFKAKIRYKEKQIPVLVERKADLIIDARRHYSKNFRIDPSIIKDSDVKFRTHKTLEICGVGRGFMATMAGKNVKVELYHYRASGAVAQEFQDLYEYYYGKGLEAITNFKPK